jgi:hypothetical protein
MREQPKHVRNFWVEVLADGRENPISTGPIEIGGGMRVLLTQRDQGRVVQSFTIRCVANGPELTTSVRRPDGLIVDEFKTKR